MAADRPSESARPDAFRAGPPRERTGLRDNLESIAIAVLLVLVVRQMVVEAFRIRHGSMAPTLVAEHREVRCPNCGWTFNVGGDRASATGRVQCPNCRYNWEGVSTWAENGEALFFGRPAWLQWVWNSARVPGGPSLATTDAANRILRGPARIFVNKFVYRMRKPKRWEVAVFLHNRISAHCRICGWRGTLRTGEPEVCPVCGEEHLQIEQRNYIKRIVGLPDERISLRDGDVYVGGQIARKPRRVQEGIWLHVYDSGFTPRMEIVPAWRLPPNSFGWEDGEDGRLGVDARGLSEPSMAEFASAITDYYAYAGAGFGASFIRQSEPGEHRVGDCRIMARARVEEAEPGASVVLAVEDGRSFSYSLGTGARGPATLSDGEGLALSAEVDGPGDEPVWLALENYDDRVVCSLRGREVLSHHYEGEPGGPYAVRFGARGARVVWERIVVERDVYYAGEGASSEPLGEGEYFVLGDNSPASSDSRRWPEPGVKEGHLIGKAFFVFWPVHRMKWLP